MFTSFQLLFAIISLSTIVSTYADQSDGNLRVLYRSLEKCSRSNYDLGSCIRLKAVSLLERALHSETPLVISEYLSLTPVKRGDDAELPTSAAAATFSQRTARSEQEIEAALPQDEAEKEAVLDDMLAEKLNEYVQSRSLQFTIPAQVAEGRKKKGGGMLLLGALAFGSMLVQLAMGKIALLAGKALLVGKIALLLSAIIGLKKLIGNSGGGESHQVVYATEGHGHGSGWGRSYGKDDADQEKVHQMVFSAQARANSL